LREISEQQNTLSWILLKQNKILGALSKIQKSNQEDKKNSEQAKRQTRNADLS